MGTIHIAPGHSAGGTLRQTIRDAGLADEVLFFRDDLSCGPIDTIDPSTRAAWWKQYHGDWDIEVAPLEVFWDRATTTEDRLIVWMSRNSARELSFFLAWTERLGERSYSVIDVTDMQLPPYHRPDGSTSVLAPAVSILPPYQLATLIGSERPIGNQEKDDARRKWSRLRAQNAAFRVVTPDGMVSAPIDHFDPLLIDHTTTEWRKVARVISGALGANSSVYYQVGDIMLFARVVALIDQGKLVADGDPSDMHVTRVRLPDPAEK